MFHGWAKPWRLIFAFIVLAFLALALALAIACAGPEPTPTPIPTPTPTPTPSPTPTPTPVPKPIVVSPEGDPQGFLQALPSGELDCLTRAFGVQGILEMMGRDPSPEDMVKLKGCLSEETGRRILLGMMVMAPGGPALSDRSLACVLTEPTATSFLDLLLQMGGEGEGPGPGFFPIMRVLTKCLSDEEMAGVQIGGGEGGGPTMAQMKCLFENADDATLAKLFAGGEGGQPPPEAMPLITKCGLTGPGGGGPGPGGGPQLTAEQTRCLTAALGEKALIELLSGQRGPTPEEVPKIRGCGLPVGPAPGGS